MDIRAGGATGSKLRLVGLLAEHTIAARGTLYRLAERVGGDMAMPYKAVERCYLTEDGTKTRGPVYHPAIKIGDDRVFTFFPDDSTESGLIEYDNPEDALKNAIMLYQHYSK